MILVVIPKRFRSSREWEERLSFRQRMQLFNFRVQVQITFSIILVGLGSLIFDLGVARRMAPWITGTIGFIVGFWMPSPGFQGTQPASQNVTQIDKPFLAIQGEIDEQHS